MGALLHDVGKIAIPDHILMGGYPLTENEWRLIKQHPVKGDEIIQPLRAYPRLKPYVRWHHEKLDGSGYPDGLTQVPLLVQTLTAADIYDALTSVRTYRNPLRPEEALEVLEEETRKGRLHREVVRAMKSSLIRNRAAGGLEAILLPTGVHQGLDARVHADALGPDPGKTLLG